MIISASRRTDIPSYYSEWFINRLHEGYALVPNPRNNNRYSKVLLTPETIDCIVFWTKNPIPILPRLEEIEIMGYPYIFQFTLTPYDSEIESGLPPKEKLIEAFIILSKRIGPSRIVWRYDPIIITEELTVDRHIQYFNAMCKALNGYTNRCVISFVDEYKNLAHRLGISKDYRMSNDNVNMVSEAFGAIAKENGMEIYTCAEEYDLTAYGIRKGACIDRQIIENALGCPIKVKRDRNQRQACGCLESLDVGAYETCGNGCIYCYASSNPSRVEMNMKRHNPKSPVLIGELDESKIITVRDSKSIKEKQVTLKME